MEVDEESICGVGKMREGVPLEGGTSSFVVREGSGSWAIG